MRFYLIKKIKDLISELGISIFFNATILLCNGLLNATYIKLPDESGSYMDIINCIPCNKFDLVCLKFC